MWDFVGSNVTHIITSNSCTATIKSIFAVEVQNSLNEELDIQIEEMVEYFDGDLVSYDKIRTVSGGDSVRDGVIKYSRISNALCGKIETEITTYSLSFSDIIVDSSNEQNEGIWRIWIGKSDTDYMIIGLSDMPLA